jgi:hypothetical protein
MCLGCIPQEETLNEILWNAVDAQDYEAVDAALFSGANPDTFYIPLEDKCGRPRPGHPFAELFLSLKEFNALFESAKRSTRFLPSAFSGHHFDINTGLDQHEFISVLMRASQLGDTRMIATLIAAGAAVNMSQPDLVYADGFGYGGMTALCFAVGNLAATQLLVEYGADINKVIKGLPGYEVCSNYMISVNAILSVCVNIRMC